MLGGMGIVCVVQRVVGGGGGGVQHELTSITSENQQNGGGGGGGGGGAYGGVQHPPLRTRHQYDILGDDGMTDEFGGASTYGDVEM
jgi:hypothetical protein